MFDRRRRLVPWALACWLAVLAPGTWAPQARASTQRQIPHGFLGVVGDGPLFLTPFGYRPANLDGELAAMAASGVETLRTSFDWNLAQPYSSFRDAQFLRLRRARRAAFADVHGVPTAFARIDRVVRLAARHGITILPVVLGTPPWARRYRAVAGSPPARNAYYARFLSALIRRYGPHGSFHAGRPIRRWVIWNEPVLTYFWGNDRNRPAGLSSYVRLLRAAFRASRRADPRAQVVMAGLPPAIDAPYPWHTLKLLYRLGARGFFDAVAVHPFTFEVSNVLRILSYMRNVMRAHGDGLKPMLVTELAWGTLKPDDETSQAAKLTLAVGQIAGQRRRLGVENVDWYTWTSFDATPADQFAFAGLEQYLPSGEERLKPAYYAWTQATRRLEGCVKTPAGRCR